jgi:hypothetical protein
MLVDTVAVICDAESHWYRVWKIAMFYRPAGEVEWHETRLTGGGRNEQKEWRAPRADMVFSREDFDTWLARYEEVPEVAMHFPRNYVTDQPVRGGKCGICGDSVTVRWENLTPVLDRLAANAIRSITLAELAAALG